MDLIQSSGLYHRKSMASYNEMHEVLKKLHMEHLFEKFESEKITPDIIGSLSSYEMEYLGITCRNRMMALSQTADYGSFRQDLGCAKD